MRRCGFCFLTLLLFAPLLVAKDKPTLSKLVLHARYVLVTTYFGDDPANPRIMPEDRQAVTDVENAIQKWGRYVPVYERRNADLIILIRKGRIAEAGAGVAIHAGTEKPSPNFTPVLNGDAGDPQDMLAVYDATEGTDNTPLWRGREPDGLKPPEMRLINEFRTRVEDTARKP